jgi:hypothetical protein
MELMSLVWPLIIADAALVVSYMLLTIGLKLRLVQIKANPDDLPKVFSSNLMDNYRYLRFLFKRGRYDGFTNGIILITRTSLIVALVGIVSYFCIILMMMNGVMRL